MTFKMIDNEFDIHEYDAYDVKSQLQVLLGKSWFVWNCSLLMHWWRLWLIYAFPHVKKEGNGDSYFANINPVSYVVLM